MHIIGLDLGTTTISGTLLNVDRGEVIATRTLANVAGLKTANAWDSLADADIMVQQTQSLLLDFIKMQPEVAAIGISGQMHGILYVSEAGKAVSPLYTWQDGRGDVALHGNLSACAKLKEKTGYDLASGYGAVTHYFQQGRGALAPEARQVCTVMDYAGMVLTGRQKPLMHRSNAASLGLFDVRQGQFDVQAMQKAGIDASFFPDVTGKGEILGTFRGIPVVCALGDHQASFLGAVKEPRQSIHVNVGTGSQISIWSNKAQSSAGFEARPWLENQFLWTQSFLCGGRAYALLEQFFRSYLKAAKVPQPSQYSVMESLAETVCAPIDPLEVTTTFSGTRRDPKQRGSIQNIGIENFTPSQLIHGFLAGISKELWLGYQNLAENQTQQPRVLIGSGNALRKNKVLRRLLSQQFDLPLHVPCHLEEASFGAALFAALSAKVLPDGAHTRDSIRYEKPDASDTETIGESEPY